MINAMGIHMKILATAMILIIPMLALWCIDDIVVSTKLTRALKYIGTTLIIISVLIGFIGNFLWYMWSL